MWCLTFVPLSWDSVSDVTGRKSGIEPGLEPPKGPVLSYGHRNSAKGARDLHYPLTRYVVHAAPEGAITLPPEREPSESGPYALVTVLPVRLPDSNRYLPSVYRRRQGVLPITLKRWYQGGALVPKPSTSPPTKGRLQPVTRAHTVGPAMLVPFSSSRCIGESNPDQGSLPGVTLARHADEPPTPTYSVVAGLPSNDPCADPGPAPLHIFTSPRINRGRSWRQ